MKVDEAVIEIEQELVKLCDLEREIATRREKLTAALTSLKTVQSSLNDPSNSLSTIFGPTNKSQQFTKTLSTPSVARQSGNRQSVISYIRDLVQKLEGEFTQPMIMKILQRDIPDQIGDYQESTVNRILRQLTREGVLEITAPASGRRAGIYRVVGQTDTSLSNPSPSYKTVLSPLDMMEDEDITEAPHSISKQREVA